MQGKAVRQSNIELLRIIAMLMIIAHHFSVHGGFSYPYDAFSVNMLWIKFIAIGGKIGVDVFVLISGYFLITSESNSVNKVLRLCAQIFSYSILIYAVVIFTGQESFDSIKLLQRIFPIASGEWWFATAYFVIYVFSPYINKILTSFDKKQYLQFLALTGLMWCVAPTFINASYGGGSILFFLFLYSVAGYIRLYVRDMKWSAAKCLICAATLIFGTFLLSVFLNWYSLKRHFFGPYGYKVYDMDSIPILLISILLFMGFLKLNIRSSRFINVISSAMFGVYLIHDDNYMRPFLWESVFKNATYSDSNLLIAYSIAVIAIVFTVCTVIELLRKYLVEKNYMRFIDYLAGKITDSYNKLIIKL